MRSEKASPSGLLLLQNPVRPRSSAPHGAAIAAAVEVLRQRPDVAQHPILMAGISRGGILSIAYAGMHPRESPSFHGVASAPAQISVKKAPYSSSFMRAKSYRG